MKILAFEHVTGGGMLGDPRMPAWAPEGDAMLRALVQDLARIPGVELCTLREPRAARDIGAHAFIPETPDAYLPMLREALAACDAAWPIAPESDGILLNLSNEILASGRVLLNSRPDAVRVAASKRQTHERLRRSGIPSIACFADAVSLPAGCRAVVAKPDDGAGCLDTRLFPERRSLREWLHAHPAGNFILQPYVEGDARSLSLICGDGTLRLLACNRQTITVGDGVFRFGGVKVGAIADTEPYEELAARICRAVPGLWGYCGVDFIETPEGPVVVEINPRLTTSYVGLRDATGINPAELVLGMAGVPYRPRHGRIAGEVGRA